MKCRKVTEMNSDGGEGRVTKNNRKLFIGACSVCGTKQSVFINKEGYYTEKTTAEHLVAKAKRAELTKKRKALKIGLKVLDNNARECVRKCIKHKVNTIAPVSKPIITPVIPVSNPIFSPVIPMNKKRRIE
jgi:hypothetical protein